MSRSVVAPALRTSWITGITLAAWRSAASFRTSTACFRAEANLGPPSFTPRALAARPFSGQQIGGGKVARANQLVINGQFASIERY
jgi:hypothetical protein